MNMSAAAPVKFAFDLDMGQASGKSRVISEYALAELLREAEQKGHQRGLIEGENATSAIAAKALSTDARNLVSRVIQIQATAAQSQKNTTENAIQFALSVARKLAGNLIARNPLGEIRSLISECFSSLENVPHLVIRCNPKLADIVKAEAETQMKISGFSGRLVVLGEPEISIGDARLEWVDGGLVRDISKISAQIDQRIEVFLEGQGITPSTPPKNSNTDDHTNTDTSAGPTPAQGTEQ